MIKDQSDSVDKIQTIIVKVRKVKIALKLQDFTDLKLSFKMLLAGVSPSKC